MLMLVWELDQLTETSQKTWRQFIFLALSPIILWYPNEFQLVVHASIGIMCTYLINYETNKERGKKIPERESSDTHFV